MKYEEIMIGKGGKLYAVKHKGATFKDDFQVVAWTPNCNDEAVLFESWSRNKCRLALFHKAL